MKKKFLFIAIAGCCLALAQSCGDSGKKDDVTEENNPPATFKAIEMPSTLVNGDAFPTDSTTIDGWVSTNHVDADGLEINENVISHAWALWEALTTVTDQKYEGRNLLLYETWYTPQDVMTATKKGMALEDLNRNHGDLQFRKKFVFGHDANLNTTAGDISGKVKYSPGMAQKALEGNYFDTLYIQSLVVPGETHSLAFSPQDVMLKPIYRVLTTLSLVDGSDDTYYFHLWGGKQDGGKQDSMFSKTVYVTTNLENPAIDNINTYGIDAFIHHNMSEAEAYTYNHSTKEGQEWNDSAVAGDPVILLGMHVSTRETQRWTWQSFYWTESPDNPVFPSSSTIADGRKSLNSPLSAQANHYAASIAYSLMSPALPLNGPAVDIMAAGVNPVYGLNPYIEGTFDASVFPDQKKFFKGDFAKQMYVANVDGITSNCMGCHSNAYYENKPFTIDNFLPDQYVQRDAPWFEGTVQLDFAWSLFPAFEPPPRQVNEKPN